LSRLAVVAFVALVLSTFAAFFVAQRLKATPTVIGEFKRTPLFSPNSDGRLDRATVRFEVRERDDVTVTVVTPDGDPVRELLDGVDARPYREIKAKWDGRDEGGRRVGDGVYRYRITLPRQGRNVVMPQSVRLDATPPRPRVLSMGPSRRPGPELLPIPGGAALTAVLHAPGSDKRVLLFKMAPGRPRLVRADPLADSARSWDWDGRSEDDRPVSPGTYLVAIETRDRAGNIGVSPALGPDGLPATNYGARLPGRGGIIVRYLGLQPPSESVDTGALLTLLPDARSRRFAWRVRRVGSPAVIARGVKTRPPLRLRAPGRESGVYLLEANTVTRSVRVPFAVQGRRRRSVLVVLPFITWQGRNAVDDDGDGLPNRLDAGLGVRIGRMLTGDGLPAGFARREAPLLAWLDRTGRRYDVTTDVALARGVGPRVEGHRGVILPSDTRWLPRRVAQRLRRFVRRGGTLLSLGTDSLRRQVELSPGGRLVDPTPPASSDLFGASPAPVQRLEQPIDLTVASDDIGLFEGTGGLFGGWREVEPVAAARSAVASAVTPGGRPVLLATRDGRGVVLRYGLPELPTRLTLDETEPVTALMARTWTLLSR